MPRSERGTYCEYSKDGSTHQCGGGGQMCVCGHSFFIFIAATNNGSFAAYIILSTAKAQTGEEFYV